MLVLKNGTFINWQTLEFNQTDILVTGGANGTISTAFTHQEANDATVIDCSGKYITRSFACGHHHAYSALARGMGAPAKSPSNFPEILQYIWWTLDKALDDEMNRYSALATAIACAKNGTTFVIDHHASPFAVKNSLPIIADAFELVGIGHLLCYEISDRDGVSVAEQGLSATENYLQQRQGLVGLHASFTVGNNTLKQAVDLAMRYNSGIHIHVAEDISDQEQCIDLHGKRVVERLAAAGALSFPKTILAHCLHINSEERSLIAASPAWVVQNTESNLNNRVGNFNSLGLGSRIMTGTDGMHSDMLRSAKAAFFSGHNYDAIDYAETYRRFRNVHYYLSENQIGGDSENNLVVLDYDSPTPINSMNFLGHFLFGLESHHVQHVIAGGKLIVRDRKVTTVDEGTILAEAQQQALRLWKKMKN